jgi:hypothetical protein
MEVFMNRKILVIGIAAIATLAGGWALAQTAGHIHDGFGPPFMQGHEPGGMGPMMRQMRRIGPALMGMDRGSATIAEMSTIHELFAGHDRIKRTVTNLPDGIRTVTESDDLRTAQLIKTHVATMGERVKAGNDPGLPIESPALHSIFQDKDKIHTTYETTATGVIVTQSSTDAATVAALQQRASEVTDFVQGGMAAMHTAMMRNGGMMHVPMMRSAPAQ